MPCQNNICRLKSFLLFFEILYQHFTWDSYTLTFQVLKNILNYILKTIFVFALHNNYCIRSLIICKKLSDMKALRPHTFPPPCLPLFFTSLSSNLPLIPNLTFPLFLFSSESSPFLPLPFPFPIFLLPYPCPFPSIFLPFFFPFFLFFFPSPLLFLFPSPSPLLGSFLAFFSF